MIAASVVLVTLLSGMAGTTYFMLAERDQAELANREAAAAIAARDAEGTARREAQANLEDFNRLASVVKLREAKAAEEDLYPAWPDEAEAMRRWIAEQAKPLGCSRSTVC